MPLSLKITDHWDDGKRIHVVGVLTPTGNYSTGGDTVPLNDPLIKSGSAPVWLQFQGQGGFNYVGVPGADGSTPPSGKMQAFTDSTGAEVAAGAYPVGITGNPPKMYAIFRKFV